MTEPLQQVTPHLWLTSRSAFERGGIHQAGVYGTRPVPLADRLVNLISPEPTSGCWLWMGKVNAAGYGTIEIEGKTKRAHRVVYVHYRGAIPEGLTLDHLCRVRSCVNPDHLEPVTRGENVRRGPAIIALVARTHCSKGHPLDRTIVQRTRTRTYTRRFCIVCRRESDRRRRTN